MPLVTVPSDSVPAAVSLTQIVHVPAETETVFDVELALKITKISSATSPSTPVPLKWNCTKLSSIYVGVTILLTSVFVVSLNAA